MKQRHTTNSSSSGLADIRSPEEIALAEKKEQVCGRMNAVDKTYLDTEARKAKTTLSHLVGRILEEYAADLRKLRQQEKKKKD